MSNISNRHNVNPFVSGQSDPLTGQRLAKVGYKSTKANPAKYPSICVSVPPISTQEITDNISALIPAIKNMLANAQDGVIRGLYEGSDGTLSSVSDNEISVLACVGFLESESSGGRLTKEGIENWFSGNLEDNLSVIIAAKLGFDMSTDEQMIVIGKHVKGYKDLLSSLSGGKTILQPVQISSLKKVLDLVSVEDDMSEKLRTRLIAMENKPKLEELLEL